MTPNMTKAPKSEAEPLLPPPTPSPALPDAPPHSNPPPSTELKGYLLMFTSSILFSFSTLLIRYLSVTVSLSPLHFYYLRSTLELPFSTLILLLHTPARRSLPHIPSHHLVLLALRGAIGSIAMLLIYLSFQYLPLGDATTLFFLNPPITLLLSHLALHEHLHPLEFLAALLSICGLLFILPPTPTHSLPASSHHWLGVFLALASALTVSISFIIHRHLGPRVHFITTVFPLALSALLISLVTDTPASLHRLAPSTHTLTLAYLSALLAVLGQCALSLAFQSCRAGTGTLVRNFDVPLSYGLGLLFLGETPQVHSFVGAAMVVSGTMLIGARQLLAM